MQLSIPPFYSTEDQLLIRRAWQHELREQDAAIALRNELTAELLLQLPARAEVVAASLLADSVERFPDLEKEFGFEIARIAHAVSQSHRLGRILHGEDSRRRELHHEFLDTIKDPRAATIKVAERLILLRNAADWPAMEQHELAEEALKMYLPLARQLGFPELEREIAALTLDILPKWDYQRGQLDSLKYEAEILGKAYHQNKLDQILLR